MNQTTGNTCCISSITMPYMTQMCTDLLCSPNTHTILIHRSQRDHQDALEEHSPQGRHTTDGHNTPAPPSIHPRDHPAPAQKAPPNAEHVHMMMVMSQLTACPWAASRLVIYISRSGCNCIMEG